MLRPYWVAEAEDDARSAIARDQGRRAPSYAAETHKYKNERPFSLQNTIRSSIYYLKPWHTFPEDHSIFAAR